jgi:hypothetical protein
VGHGVGRRPPHHPRPQQLGTRKVTH